LLRPAVHAVSASRHKLDRPNRSLTKTSLHAHPTWTSYCLNTHQPDTFISLTRDCCNYHVVQLTSPGVLSVMQLPQFGKISPLIFILPVYSWTFVHCYVLTFTYLFLI